MTAPERTQRSTAAGLYAEVKKAGNRLQDQLMAESLQTRSAGLIIRQKEPANLETPLDQVDSYLTPTELFYIRSHYPAPRLELASYQLCIDGAVRKPLSLSYQQLRDMP